MLEKTIAVLENAKYSTCYASGIGAIGIINFTLESGDHILCIDDVYEGTMKYYEKIVNPQGIEITFADLTCSENLKKHMKPNTKILWLETPSNPLCKVLDIIALSALAKTLNPNCIVVVDNSYLSCYNLRPLELGADVSVSSLTKYINGHADVTMGAIATNDKTIHEKVQMFQITIGVIPSPFDCYLVLRGLKTLGCRMKQHMKSAFKIAKYLRSHPMVEKVLYPGFPSHPGHEIALKQWHGLSGMLSFYLNGDLEQTVYFVKQLKLFSIGLSYGGFESLVELPYTMSSNATKKEELKEHGIAETLIRMSVGLEIVEDLIEDLDHAFEAVCLKFHKRNQSLYSN